MYRNAHHRFYGGIARYYTPFIAPNQCRKLTSREMNDILPEHNEGMNVVPQILTNRAEDFVWAAGKAKELGYEEVNLNLGCPSGTVAAKKRGAGFLSLPRELDCFLEQVTGDLGRMGIKFSIKTRIGICDPEEFGELLRIFNKYPLERLIIHPRLQIDFYRNHPDRRAFGEAEENSSNPLCYNGDIFSVKDFQDFHTAFPRIDTIMMGRGLLQDPALAEKIVGKEMKNPAGSGESARTGDYPGQSSDLADTAGKMKGECSSWQALPLAEGMPSEEWLEISVLRRLKDFHDSLLEGYREAIPGDRNVLFKMKELWSYLGVRFQDQERLLKKIKKATKIREYKANTDQLFGGYI